jgi:hypothetical protein
MDRIWGRINGIFWRLVGALRANELALEIALASEEGMMVSVCLASDSALSALNLCWNEAESEAPAKHLSG